MQLIDTYLDRINFNALARNKTLTADIILKYWSLFENDSIILKYPYITPAWVEAHSHLRLNTRGLALNPNFNHINLPTIDWHYYGYNPSLTIAIMEANIHKLNWYTLSYNPNLTWSFIQANLTKAWNWYAITFDIIIANPTLQ